MAAAVRIYGATWCPDTARPRQFLKAHGVPYEFHDVDRDPQAAEMARRASPGQVKGTIPAIYFADDSVLIEPSNAQLAEKLGVAEGGGPVQLGPR